MTDILIRAKELKLSVKTDVWGESSQGPDNLKVLRFSNKQCTKLAEK